MRQSLHSTTLEMKGLVINLGLKFFIDFFINIHYNKLLGTTDDITDDITDGNITKDNDILLSST